MILMQRLRVFFCVVLFFYVQFPDPLNYFLYFSFSSPTPMHASYILHFCFFVQMFTSSCAQCSRLGSYCIILVYFWSCAHHVLIVSSICDRGATCIKMSLPFLSKKLICEKTAKKIHVNLYLWQDDCCGCHTVYAVVRSKADLLLSVLGCISCDRGE